MSLGLTTAFSEWYPTSSRYRVPGVSRPVLNVFTWSVCGVKFVHRQVQMGKETRISPIPFSKEDFTFVVFLAILF